MTGTQTKLFEQFTSPHSLGPNMQRGRPSHKLSQSIRVYLYGMANQSKRYSAAVGKIGFLSNVCIVSSSGVDMFIALHISLQKQYTVFERTQNKKPSFNLKLACFFFANRKRKKKKNKNRRRQHDFLPFHPVGSIDNDENT